MICNNLKYLILFLLASLTLEGCSTNEPDSKEPEAVTFCLGSRSGSEESALTVGSTYRVVAYHTKSFTLYKTDTFVLEGDSENNPNTVLTPCQLNDDGEKLEGEYSRGINRQNYTYLFFVVSPGVKVNDDGTFNLKVGDNKKFYASEQPESMYLGNYGSIVFSKPLKEYKSTITLRFYKSKDPSVQEFEIEDVYFLGAGKQGEEVKLHPATRQVEVDNSIKYVVGVSNVKSNNETDKDGNPLYYQTDAAEIVPGIYAGKEIVAEKLNTDVSNVTESNPLIMWCKMKDGDRDNINIHINLTESFPSGLKESFPEMKPQCNYIYNIIVSSNYFDMTMEVYTNPSDSDEDWEFGGNDNAEIKAPTEIYCGKWGIVKSEDDSSSEQDNIWELTNLNEQKIE